MNLKYSLLILMALGSLLGAVYSQEKSRTWTSSDGKQIEGTLEGVDGDTVKLRTSRGVFPLPITRLSEPDQKYIAEWKANAPLTIGAWPEGVESARRL